MNKTICALLCVALPALAWAEDSGDIEVTVNSLKSDEGQVFVSRFDKAEGFPGEEAAAETLQADIENGQARVLFEDVPYGEYAFAAHHDEDGDGKMKTVYGSIPLEGIGVSRDARGVMGPPKFKDAKVDLASESMSLEINVNY